LANGPVLVLDEPTVGLDADMAAALLADIGAAAGGRTVLLITHHEHEVAGFETRVVVEEGRVSQVERGPTVTWPGPPR
jgi:ATP-binding cassette subfamily C protein CydC